MQSEPAPKMLEVDREWMTQASCKGTPPSVFHPAKGEFGLMKQALTICNGEPKTRKKAGKPPCPVREQCLAFAMSLPQSVDLVGVYGGKTHKQRLVMRREINRENGGIRPPCGTTAGFNFHRRNAEPACIDCKIAEHKRREDRNRLSLENRIKHKEAKEENQ